MKNKILFTFVISLFASVPMFGQNQKKTTDIPRNERVVVTENIKISATPTPTPRKILIIPQLPSGKNKPKPRDTPTGIITSNTPRPAVSHQLRFNDIKSKIEEAKRQMRIKPLRISMSDKQQTHKIVRIAFYDPKRDQIDYVVIRKVDFLSTKSDVFGRSELGKHVRVQTIRGNGVNTPVIVYDSFNQAFLPLVVQYPIEKFGKFREMSYYISTHPGLSTPGTINAGRLYVRNMLDTARAQLRKQGIFIQPKVVDIAERLALVEHVDHSRFRKEYHPKIYNDVYTLYALNRGRTYRYSVSRAGAGGMVQMIPSTYRMMRSRYYSVGLMPDFVEGMRNHLNASKAMLLYMQMTWNDLVSNSTVYSAMQRGIATQEQLMAAGYNSNPARLKIYIRRGGANWTRLIPRETKVYLRIYKSVERYVPMRPRTQ